MQTNFVLNDQSEEDGKVRAFVELPDNPEVGGQAWIVLQNKEGLDAGTIMVELYEGKVHARVWREQDEGNDPCCAVVLVEKPHKTHNLLLRTFD